MSAISTFYSEQKQNYLYAPGIATYGIDGKTGENGQDGTSIYYSNIPFSNNNFSIIVSKIINNEALIYNSSEKIQREYKKDDIFISPNGYFWRLEKDKSELIDTDSYNYNIERIFLNIGKINLEGINNLVGTEGIDDGKAFALYDNNSYIKIYNKNYNGIDFVDEYLTSKYPEIQENLEKYIVNIVGSQKSDYLTSLLNLAVISNQINMRDPESLSIEYDYIDSAFHIKSTVPILLDIPDLRIKKRAADTVDSYDKYSPITIYNHPFTEFYKFVSNYMYWKSNSEENKIYVYCKENPTKYSIPLGDPLLWKILIKENNTYIEKIISQKLGGDTVNELHPMIITPADFSVDNIASISLIDNIEVFISKQ